MFDRLFDIIIGFWESLLPFIVVAEYERAVVLRLGRPRRILNPGFHFIIPFVESTLSDNVVPRTNWTTQQTGLTKDNKVVSVEMIMTWRIEDIRKALLEVERLDDAIRDTYVGVIGDAIASHNFEQLNDRSFLNKIKRDCKKKAERFGVLVEDINIAEIVLCRSAIRLVGNIGG